MTETYRDNDDQVWLLIPNDGYQVSTYMCDVCVHPLANHYVTFDNKFGGCTGTDYNVCGCEGFMHAQ